MASVLLELWGHGGGNVGGPGGDSRMSRNLSMARASVSIFYYRRFLDGIS